MNREHFLALLRDSTLAEKQLDEVKILTDKYPYSQPLRALLAKGTKKADAVKYNQRISTAAIYAVDRNALKSYIQNVDQQAKTQGIPKTSQPVKKPKRPVDKAAPISVPPVQKKAPQKAVKGPLSPKPITSHSGVKPITDSEALRNEVLHNLQELIKHKQDVAVLFAEDKKTSGHKASKTKPSVTAKKKETKTTAAKKIIDKKTAPKPKPSQKKKPRTATKESTELINTFIKTSPSITPNKKIIGDQVDLSVQSVEFNDDLVSENLAEIFARQGKTKKAIEIYRKLIWKFPQKKAFFASRIEEIKLRN